MHDDVVSEAIGEEDVLEGEPISSWIFEFLIVYFMTIDFFFLFTI